MRMRSASARGVRDGVSTRARFGVGILGLGLLGVEVAVDLAVARISRRRMESLARRQSTGVQTYAGPAQLDAFLRRYARARVHAAADARDARPGQSRRACRGCRAAPTSSTSRAARCASTTICSRRSTTDTSPARCSTCFADEPLPAAQPFLASSAHRGNASCVGSDADGRFGRADRRQNPPPRSGAARHRHRGSRTCLLTCNSVAFAPALDCRAACAWSRSVRATVCKTKRPTSRPRSRSELIDRLTRRGIAGHRVGELRVAQVGAADGRRRRGDGADSSQARRALSRADAEPEGVRGGTCRQVRRGRGLRRGVGDFFPAATSTARSQTASHACARSRTPRGRTACGCAATCRACLAAPTKAISIRPRCATSRPRCSPWDATRSRWATPSASARPAVDAGDDRESLRGGACRVPGGTFPRYLRPGADQRLRGDDDGREPPSTVPSPGSAVAPTRKGATGNVASEDLLYLLDGLGIETGVDMTAASHGGTVHLRLHRSAADVARGEGACRQGSVADGDRRRERGRCGGARRVALHKRLHDGRCDRIVRRMPAHARRDRELDRPEQRARGGRCLRSWRHGGERSPAPPAPRRGAAMASADWYFDFVSPFAYLQCEQLAALETKINIRYRPILFAGLLKAHGHKGPAEIAAKRLFTYRFVVWQAKQLGIALKFPPVHPFNPLPLLRLAVAADGDPEVVRTIFRFVWRDGRLGDLPIEWAELMAMLGTATPPALPSSRRARRRPTSRKPCGETPTRPSPAEYSACPRSPWETSCSGAATRPRMAAEYIAHGCRLHGPGDDADRKPAGRRRTRSRQAQIARSSAASLHAPGYAESRLDVECSIERRVEGRREAGHVAHLAAATRLRLAVQMQLGARMLAARSASPARVARPCPASAYQMSPSRLTITARRCCARVAERKIGEHAHLLLELRRHASVDRKVSAVVRPRGDLVDQQAAIREHEHLDAKHAAIVELVGDVEGHSPGLRGQRLRDARRHDASYPECRRDARFSQTGQVTASPLVLARHDDRHLQRQGDELLDDAGACPASMRNAARISSTVLTRTCPLPS